MFFAFVVALGNITGASCKYEENKDITAAVVCFLIFFGISNAVGNKPFLDDVENAFISLSKIQDNLSLSRDPCTIPRKYKAAMVFPKTLNIVKTLMS